MAMTEHRMVGTAGNIFIAQCVFVVAKLKRRNHFSNMLTEIFINLYHPPLIPHL